MSWSFYPDADAFSHAWREVLLENESAHCLTWAAIARSSGGAQDDPSLYRFLGHERTENQAAFAIFSPRNRELFLSKLLTPKRNRTLPEIPE